MRILYYELRKIWRLPVVMAIVFLGIVQYFLFMEFDIRFFPNGHPAAEQYGLAREWTEKYGPTMEPDEYEDAKQSYAALIAGTDARIAADARFRAHGISTWGQFSETVLQSPEAEGSGQYSDIRNLLYTEEYAYLGYRIEALSSALFSYEIRVRNPGGGFEPQTAAERARAEALSAPGRMNGIFPEQCVGNLSEYLCWASIFGVVSVAVLLGAGGTRENLSRMPGTLWSSRTGRHVAGYQFAAALLSAGLLFAAETLVYGGIYARLGTKFFWSSLTQSFLGHRCFWFDLTYGQYALCLLGFALALMLGMAGTLFALSQASDSYISAIWKALPVTVAMIFAAAMVTQWPFTERNELYRHVRVFGVEAVLCGLLLLAGVSAGLLAVHRAQGKERLE